MRRRLDQSDVKSHGLTVELHWKLSSSRVEEAGGISGVAVECVDIRKNTRGEGGLLVHF